MIAFSIFLDSSSNSARPSAIFKKMMLVSPGGLKPPEVETWDYFVNSGKEAFEQAFHKPAQSPEYAQYYGNEWDPEEAEQVEINR